MSTRQRLLDATTHFCSDFARNVDTDTLVSHFSNACQVVEHGLPTFAPFLGTPFSGRDGAHAYFTAVAAFITYRDMHFSEYVIDHDVRKVSVKGTATFTWKTTGQSWDETFAYVLDYGDEYKIARYQIWGDTGAMYLASQGRVNEVCAT